MLAMLNDELVKFCSSTIAEPGLHRYESDKSCALHLQTIGIAE